MSDTIATNEATPDVPVIVARNLSKYFDVSQPLFTRIVERLPKRSLKAVNDVSFAIRKGETFSLVGESGCGKSTIAKLVVGLHQPSGGSLQFCGTDLANIKNRAEAAKLQRRWQMIFQDPFASLNPRWRVQDIVAEPLRAFRLEDSRAKVDDRVGELLVQVGLSADDGAKYPHEFSGGQRQRISIARALASKPEFIVCDEPTSALDVSVQAQILNLMTELQEKYRLTYLFISHNLAVVYHVSDRIGVMYLGRLCEVADKNTLFSQPGHPYTKLLLETIPDLEMTERSRTPLAGEVPNPISPPSGCTFHPRCPLANDRCRSEVPELLAHGRSMIACHARQEGR